MKLIWWRHADHGVGLNFTPLSFNLAIPTPGNVFDTKPSISDLLWLVFELRLHL